MTETGWDRARPPRRWPVAVGVLGAVVLVALLLRPGSPSVRVADLAVEQPDAQAGAPTAHPSPAEPVGAPPAVCRERRGSLAQQLPPRDGWRTVLELPVRGAAPTLIEADDRLVAVDGREDAFRLRLAVLDRRGGWSCAPPAPITSRVDPVVVWTGREVLIYGGHALPGVVYDGAAYDPARDRWRVLPQPPRGTSGEPAAAVWTGEELVVVGSRGGEQPPLSAAYDPDDDAWRPIARTPVPLSTAVAAWVGERVLVVGALLDDRNATILGLTTLAYDPRTNTWVRLADAPPELMPQALAGALVDKQLVVADRGLTLAAYDPVEDRWSSLPPPPLAAGECTQEALGLPGGTFVLDSCNAAAVLDGVITGAQTWEVVALPPSRERQRLVALGGEVLLLDGERVLRRTGS